jgi:HKD family nuclease
MPDDQKLLLNDEAAEVLSRSIAWSEAYGFAVAWASENPVLSRVVEHAEKLRHGVVGTHFYQTHPAALKRLATVARARVMLPSNELFHPKVWWFTRNGAARCVIGSHNLTRAAHLGGNVEASLIVECNSASGFVQSLQRFVTDSWNNGCVIEEPFLSAYELQWRATRSLREALTEFVNLPPMTSEQREATFALTWPGFVQGVWADRHHSAEGRLAILELSRGIFAMRGTFARMNRDERKAIAGTYGRAEAKLGGHDWAWFGSMSGHGDFKHLVIEDYELLSKALDHIPLVGEVSEEMYGRYVRDFISAFEQASHKGGLATGTRLLALKRPDWFVAVNAANQKEVCRTFGVAHTTTNLGNYWKRIVKPLHMTRWYNISRPSDPLEGRIWECRAALLDSLLYEPV